MESKTILSDNRLERVFHEDKPLYSESEARAEANRCLYCYDAPCTAACPTGIDIPGFIRKIASGNIRGAARTIFKNNLLGVSTSRVCPVEVLCVGACVYNKDHVQPVNIGKLQRYATEKALQLEKKNNTPLISTNGTVDRKVALIGGGPASLACAGYLSLAGVKAVIYEKHNFPGGLNVTGIAPYKLKSEAALAEIAWLQQLGFEIQTGVEIGRDITFDHLTETFDAVFLGAGLGLDKQPGISGEDLPGVWGATDLIAKIKNEPNFKLPGNLHTVNVIGGGNSAIDVARELALLGVPEVNIIYRRTVAEMPGYRHELDAARKLGVRMIEEAVPVSITHNDRLVLTTHHKARTAETRQFESDWIVIAIGNACDAGRHFSGLKVDAKGWVIVDPDTLLTSIPGVYAGGDCINGGKEVVNAVADGRNAAFAMLREWGIQPAEINRRSNG